jgi:hypothetical protein
MSGQEKEECKMVPADFIYSFSLVNLLINMSQQALRLFFSFV